MMLLQEEPTGAFTGAPSAPSAPTVGMRLALACRQDIPP